MPHFIIEYSRPLENTLDLKEVMQIAFESGVQSGVMQADNIKVRAIPYDYFRLEGGLDTFLHVSVFLLAGRTAEQKEHVSTLLRKNIGDAFPAIGSLSIDIRDMDPVAYKKRVNP